MDCTNTIGKKKEQTIIKNLINRNGRECEMFTNKKITVKKYKEDKRLTNWKKWLKIHQKQHKFLSRATNRLPEELVLNSVNKYQNLIEMKTKVYMLTRALDIDPVKLRSIEPGFWRTSEFLSDKINIDYINEDSIASLKPAPVFVTVTEKERKQKIEVTTNFTPDIILEEKKLKPVDKVNNSWKRNEYLKTQIKNAPPKLLSAVFAKPLSKISKTDLIEDKENKQLGIKGRKLKCNDSKVKLKKSFRTTNVIQEYGPLVELSPSSETIVGKCSKKVRLKMCFNKSKEELLKGGTIRKSIFFSEEQKENVYFITLENIGDVIISYWWQKLRNFLEEKQNRIDSAFFFNKNAGKILPGEKVEISIWFNKELKGRHPCPQVFIEFWTLQTKPDPAIICTFRMFAITNLQNEDNLNNQKNELISINRHLDNYVKDRFIRQIIEDVLIKAYKISEEKCLPQQSPFESFFYERELFEIFNKNYCYHGDKILELKKLYKLVDNVTNWDLSPDTLKMKIKESSIDPEMKREYLTKLHDICKHLLCPSAVNVSQEPNCCNTIIADFLNCFETEHAYVIEHCYVNEHNYSLLEYEEYIEDYEGDEERYTNLRKEIFFLRILSRLKETVERMCNEIDYVKKLRNLEFNKVMHLCVIKKPEHKFSGIKMRLNKIF